MRKVIALVMVLAMMMSVAACAGKTVKELDAQSAAAILTDKLGIPADEVKTSETEANGGVPAATTVTAKYNNIRINVMISNTDYSKQLWDKTYNQFVDEFNKSNMFSGNYWSNSGDDNGYVVIKGEKTDTSIFGDRYRTSKIYAGYYYAGSMIVMILPEQPEVDEDVGKVIDAFGFPGL